MVYASPSTLGWRPIVTSWILKMTHESMTEKVKEQLAAMFEIHIDNTFELF